jgi:uncharacterized protein
MDSMTIQVLRANTFFLRARGLFFRKALSPGQGLLLTPCNSIHTVGMSYAIDVVFLGQTNQVLKLARSVAPWRITSQGNASAVLELAAGEINRQQIRLGQILNLLD